MGTTLNHSVPARRATPTHTGRGGDGKQHDHIMDGNTHRIHNDQQRMREEKEQVKTEEGMPMVWRGAVWRRACTSQAGKAPAAGGLSSRWLGASIVGRDFVVQLGIQSTHASIIEWPSPTRAPLFFSLGLAWLSRVYCARRAFSLVRGLLSRHLRQLGWLVQVF